MSDCVCRTPPLNYKDYTIVTLGVDTTNGRFADVTIQTCLHCGTKWLNYLVQFEAFTGSGRWYRAVVTEKELTTMTPENAVAFLEHVPFYMYGGSYFEHTGKYGKGKVSVDQ